MTTLSLSKAPQEAGPIEEIPVWERISPWGRLTDWATQAAWNLTKAAGRCSPPFEVGVAGFEGKLLGAPQIAVAYHQAQVKALTAVTSLVLLRRTGLLARYVAGAMVDPLFKQLETGVSFSSLLDVLDVPRADILVLHTQNPRMARALWAKGPYGFPGPDDCRSPLDERLQKDLEEMLLTVGRRPDFDPVTGLVPECYESAGALYATTAWPLPGSHEHETFRTLGRNDGVLILGSKLASTAELGLALQLMPALQEVAA